ncbi:hypothetical protein BJY52DRAFT_1383727 [Lactarius psammicola]|nr:hypothetical protein BJY52DRAFT_1383727 [Lactarius psammicola]
MSSDPSSESNLQSLFETALKEYEKQAGKTCLTIPSLSSCKAAILWMKLMLSSKSKHRRSTNFETIHLLHGLSTSSALSEGVGLAWGFFLTLSMQPFPPARAIFAEIGILLTAIKDVRASYDALVDHRVDRKLPEMPRYLYQIPPTMAMTEIIVKILIELLSTLALATRLDRLNHEEARMTVAQTLEVVYGLVKKLKVIVDSGKTSMEDTRQTLVVMQQIASHINKSQRDRLQDKSQQWLSPAHPSTKYDIGREAYHDGTATWFIRGTTCCKWVGSDGDSERAQARASSEATRLYDAGLASMAYFFFGFKDTAKRDARAVFSYLLV